MAQESSQCVDVLKCITSGGQFNNKYIQRHLFKLFSEIGVKDKTHDFHSFIP